MDIRGGIGQSGIATVREEAGGGRCNHFGGHNNAGIGDSTGTLCGPTSTI